MSLDTSIAYMFPVNAVLTEAENSGFLELNRTGHPYLSQVSNAAGRKIMARYHDPNFPVPAPAKQSIILDVRTLKNHTAKNEDARFFVVYVDENTAFFEVD